MKAKIWVLGVVVLGAAITAACSSTPSHPPIETSGGSNPGPGGGGSSNPAHDADGGTTASGGDAGTSVGDSGAAPTSCNNGNCNGCCDTLLRCQAGTSSAACGVSGGMCLTCQAGAICSGGFCQ